MPDRMVPQKKEILDLLEQNQAKIKALGVKKLGLFGSFVREQHQRQSDIDVLVEFQTGRKTFDNFMGLAFLLEELLQRRVELVTPESLSPYIRPHVLEEVEYVDLAL